MRNYLRLFRLIVVSAILCLASAGIVVATPEIDIKQIDANNFPFIFLVADVTENGIPISDLTKEDFSISEDGRSQTDYFDVTPPEQSGGVRIVDFVFLIDNSGSMGTEIAAVRNNVNSFADLMAASGIDLRLGAVRFGQGADGGAPQIFNSGNLTGDLSEFHSWIDQMYASGGTEPGLQAIIDAATTFNFRPGSQRHFLIITDEDSDYGSLSGAISICNSNNIVVHGAVNCSYGMSYLHYCSPVASITGMTGGLVFSVVGPYEAILDELSEVIANTYVVRYKTDNPNYDGQQREVVLGVTMASGTDSDVAYYTPGAGPRIVRTQQTVDLSLNAPIAGQALTIQAAITDDVPPGVASARLYYKHSETDDYTSVSMIDAGESIYSAQIPSSVVASPGVHYYITATDGQLTSSDPPVEPGLNPYDIAVLPNVAPVIEHQPVTEAEIGQMIPIIASVTDNTNNVESVVLYYRKTGTLLFDHTPMPHVNGDIYVSWLPSEVLTMDGVDYYIRAWDDLAIGTTHGIHNIDIKPLDSDGDALPDIWEREGYDHDGDGIVDVDLPAMGADPMHKDIFVEIDWMEDAWTLGWCLPPWHSHEPDQATIDELVRVFAEAPVSNPDGENGISLHLDIGDLGGGGQTFPHQRVFEIPNESHDGLLLGDFAGIKGNPEYFDPAREHIFHYCLFVHSLSLNAGGAAPAPGVDLVIALSCEKRGMEEAGTLMHELGHNLGLGDGGVDFDPNLGTTIPNGDHRKPNHLSVMNYNFQLSGLTIDGRQGNLDYNRFDFNPLNEWDLSEPNGISDNLPALYGVRYLCPDGSWEWDLDGGAIDWNCNGDDTEENIESDLNGDGLNFLTSYNEWSHLRFSGAGGIGYGVTTPENSVLSVEPPIEELRAAWMPVPPGSITAEPKLGFVEIAWDSIGVEEDSLILFTLYRGSDADFSAVTSTLNHTFPDSSAPSGVTSQYFVESETQWGQTSPSSMVVDITTFGFDGIFPPFKPDSVQIWTFGRSIPIKFRLLDLQGNIVPDAHAIVLLQEFKGASPSGRIIEASSAGGANIDNIVRFLPEEQQYIYNLDTEVLSPGQWMIRVLIDDGTTHRAIVELVERTDDSE